LSRGINSLPGLRLCTADRPDDGVVGHQRIERLEAHPDQPHARSCRALLGGQASAQLLAGQKLIRAGYALDEPGKDSVPDARRAERAPAVTW
jgi:hypothetical protein